MHVIATDESVYLGYNARGKILETIFGLCVLGVGIIHLKITYAVLFLKQYSYFVGLLLMHSFSHNNTSFFK